MYHATDKFLSVLTEMAEGTTTVTGVHYIDRGYEKIVEKLQNLGADIKRIQ